MNCLPDPTLLRLALGDAPEEGGPFARHVDSCTACRIRLEEFRYTIGVVEASAAGANESAAGCIGEHEIARLLEAGSDSPERRAALAHLEECSRCRRELAALAELLADAGVSDELRRVARAGSGRKQIGLMAAGGLAAAAVLTLLLVPQNAPNAVLPEHRGATLTATDAPVPVAPSGDVPAAAELVWSAVAGADRYRVTVFSATGEVIFETQTAEVAAPVPDSVVFAPGRTYLWKVEARTGLDRWTTSELREFRVGTPPGSGAARSMDQDTLRALARTLSDTALVAAVRARPVIVREAVSAALAMAANGEPRERDSELTAARRIAAAWASAWQDPFLVREVERFSAWPQGSRDTKVRADSLRRMGTTAFNRDGAATAIAIWRRGLRLAESIPDTAATAALLGNIGAALAWDGQLDSAVVYLTHARSLAALTGDIRVQANVISELAGVADQRNDPAAAIRYYRTAIDLHGRIGDARGLARDYNNLAGLARAAGDLDEARRSLESALSLNRSTGEAQAVATNLVNLAAIAGMSGDFATAAAQYREALAVWRQSGRWADVADGERGLGELEIRRGDYPSARDHLLQAVSLYDRTGPLSSALGVRRELATIRAAEGDLQGAIDDLRQTQSLADSSGAGPAVQAAIALARADLALQLNAELEAERSYSDAVQLYHRAGDRVGEAGALEGRGILFLQREDSVRARESFDAAIQAQLSAGDARAVALIRLWLGRTSLLRGDTAGARIQIVRASAELHRLGDPVASAAALGEHAGLELSAGLPAVADSLYRLGLVRVGDREAPDVTWRLHAGLSEVRLKQRLLSDAAAENRAAIDDIELAGRSFALPERRSDWFADKWDVYVQRAFLELARGSIAESFDMSERVRANEMLELLGRGRIAVASDTAADLIAREQDLRRQMAGFSTGLSAGSADNPDRGPDVSRAAAVSRERLMQAQQSYSQLLLEMRERAPRHADLVSRATSGWRDVAKRLDPDEAFIEYLTSEDRTLAFVVTRDTIASLSLSAGRTHLARLIDFTRATLAPRGSQHLDSLWRAPLQQLERELVTPIESSGLLKGKRRLVITPHAELHYLPFAALLSDDGRGRFLVERFQLTITPSASVWLALGSRPRRRSGKGVLALAPRPDALPYSRQEVASISRLTRDAHVFTGSDATEALFRNEAPGRRVIHLATLGVLNKQNPLFSFIQLAPGSRDDGELDVHEVFGLRLAADLVVLSACQTALGAGALGDVPAGDDWIGLTRAFLSAGADRVMATLWPVEDDATARLMEVFYRSWTLGSDPARALALAQRSALRRPDTSSPWYWAGFEVVGGR